MRLVSYSGHDAQIRQIRILQPPFGLVILVLLQRQQMRSNSFVAFSPRVPTAQSSTATPAADPPLALSGNRFKTLMLQET